MRTNWLTMMLVAILAAGCSESSSACNDTEPACSGDGGAMTGSGEGGAMTGAEDAAPDTSPPALPARSTLALEDGAAGIGFDDLRYSSLLDRLIVPAGRAGYVGLVDPLTSEVTKLTGFSTTDTYAGGHDFGTTSAIEAEGLVYAIDRTAQELRQVDPDSGDTLAAVPLAAAPDYVRFVAATSELWVTEPTSGQFEIFSLGSGDPPELSNNGTMPVSGGPESLVAPPTGSTLYTNSFVGQTIPIDAEARTEQARWSNGCSLSLGLAVDVEAGLAFVGCPEGKAVSLDLESGDVLSTVDVAGGVDIIAYNPSLSHLYLNGSTQGELTVVGVAGDGTLTTLATEPTAPSTNSSCVASDPYDNIWVCDANAGQLLRFTDTY